MERAETDFHRDVYSLMGLPIDAVSMQGAVQRVREAAFQRKSCVIATPNLNFVMMALHDAAFRDSVLRSDLVLADGMPLVWVARLLGLPIRERVPGAGLFENLLAHPGPPVTVYFFGGPEGAAEAASKRINQAPKGLRCVGFNSPGFGSVEAMSTDEYIQHINASEAQFVIVALGAKKGQAWIEHNRERLNAPVICHLGAVVNFAAGTVKRAPRWVQNIGAEWLWRISEEPALWRRYWADGTDLLQMIFTQVLPLAVRLRLSTSRSNRLPPATLSLAETSIATTLTLSGAWAQADMCDLRGALEQAQRTRKSLNLNISASSVDLRLIGLLQLVRGSKLVRGASSIEISSPIVRSTFSQSNASWLLESVGPGRG